MPRQTMACSLPVLCCGKVKLMRQLRHVPHVLERQFERLTKPSAGTRFSHAVTEGSATRPGRLCRPPCWRDPMFAFLESVS